MNFIKINNDNRHYLIQRYLDKLLSPGSDYGKYRMLEQASASSFLREEKTLLSDEELQAQILERYPFVLEPYYGLINGSNRTEIIDKYVYHIVSDLSMEIPRYKLWDCASRYLIKEKSSLSNHDLEAEIVSTFPELLMENSND